MTSSPDDRAAEVDDTETALPKASTKPAPKTTAAKTTAAKTTAAKTTAAGKRAPAKPAPAKRAAPKKPIAKTTTKSAAEKAAPTADVIVEPLKNAMLDGATAKTAPKRVPAAARTAAAKNTAARASAAKAPTSTTAAAKTTAAKTAAAKTAAAKTAAAKTAAAKTAAAKTAAAKSTARSTTAKTAAAKTAAAKTAAAKAAAAKAAAEQAVADKAAAEQAAADKAAAEQAVADKAAAEQAVADKAAAEQAATEQAAAAEQAVVVETSAVTPAAPVVEASPAVAEMPPVASDPAVENASVSPKLGEADAPAVTVDDDATVATVAVEAEPAQEVTSVEVVEAAVDSDDAASDAVGAIDSASGGEAISIRGLVKQFGDNRAVAGIDLTVPAGSFYGVVGPNGAGKTTTLSIVAGLLRADEGSVVICGIDQAVKPQAAKRMMGVLPDRLRTFDRLTGRQLLYYYGLLRGLTADVIEKRAADLARAFDLGDALSRVVSDYSAGMTKKIMLAGAMIHSPRVLVLDEPFESVDPVSSAVILDILRAYVSHGGTVILSSHGMDLVERVCSRVAIIVNGEVLAEGTIDEVRAGQTLEARFVELAGSSGEVEGLEWLHTFSD
ncbi:MULTISPECIES: ABC transporter ATP-binding protein [unclassified Microbacterium]|uniref:ABC transporter ATP-binding protein n=1 Tax=unclassified Microbacterium TaxID=2609290 RepID=UPI001F117AA8|nr:MULTISPECIES: ABC transporter ATP-binding protein [unclassified Microbacterium]